MFLNFRLHRPIGGGVSPNELLLIVQRAKELESSIHLRTLISGYSNALCSLTAKGFSHQNVMGVKEMIHIERPGPIELEELRKLIKPGDINKLVASFSKLFENIVGLTKVLKDPLGTTLHDWIYDQRVLYSSSCPPEWLYYMQLQMCQGLLEGLSYLHYHEIIHGAICTQNVMSSPCTSKTEFPLPIRIANVTSSHEDYMAPQLRKRCQKPTVAGDVYALGKVLKEIILIKHNKFWTLENHPILINAKEVIDFMTHYDIKKRTQDASKIRFFVRDSLMLPRCYTTGGNEKGVEWMNNITLGRKLGEGSFSTVMSAFDHNKRMNCALKILFGPQMQVGDDSCASDINFASEFTKLQQHDHTNLVKVYNYKEAFLTREQMLSLQTERVTNFIKERSCALGLQVPIIQMELCGPSLKQWLEDEERPADYIRQLAIINGLVSVLEHIHYRGILHMDIKPENVFFSNGLEEYSLPIKLGDFGLSSYMLDRDKVTLGLEQRRKMQNLGLEVGLGPRRGGTDCFLLGARATTSLKWDLPIHVGTPSYMAPEVDEGFYGEQADYYSLGLVIWEVTNRIRAQDRSHLFKRLKQGDTTVVLENPLISNSKQLIVQMTHGSTETRLKNLYSTRFCCGGNGVLYATTGEELSILVEYAYGGSVIQLEEGIFQLKKSLTIRNPIRIIGRGPHCTKLISPGQKSNTVISVMARCCVEGLSIFGNDALVEICSKNCSLKNVSLCGNGKDVEGIKVILDEGHLFLDHVKIKNCDWGISLYKGKGIQGSDLKYVKISHCRTGLGFCKSVPAIGLDGFVFSNCCSNVFARYRN